MVILARLALFLDGRTFMSEESYRQYKDAEIARGIVIAHTYLMTLKACPSCQRDVDNNIVGIRQTSVMGIGYTGEVDQIRCRHPFHDTQYLDGNPQNLVEGLPNHSNFSRDWVKRMQSAAFEFADRNGMLLGGKS